MKKFNNYYPNFLILALFFIVSFNAFAQETREFYITHDNKKIYLIKDDKGRTVLKDDAGNTLKVNRKDYRFFVYDQTLNLSFEKGPIQRVIAFNDKYILTYYVTAKKLYSVWDRNFKEVETDINVNYSVKKREQILKETIFKYFKDCEKLQEALLTFDQGSVTSNYYRSEPLINYYNCGNAQGIILEDGKTPSYITETLVIGEPDPIDFGINNKGEKIFFYEENTLLDGQIFKYIPKYAGITATVTKIDDWKTLYIRKNSANRVFKKFQTDEGVLSMSMVLAFSDKYVLTSDKSSKMGRYFIHDRKGSMIENLFTEDKLVDMCNKYFKEYPQLKELVENNIKKEIKNDEALIYIKCGESTIDMINE